MKNAVVFYSHDGSTRVAANIIAEKYSAEIFELEEVKKRGRSALSFVAAGFSAATGKASKLKSIFEEELKSCERIYVGTPIWAGKPVPAINTFVKKSDFTAKEIVLFTVQADKNPDVSSAQSTDIIKTALEQKGAKVINITRLSGNAPGKTASMDDMKIQIESKLK